MPKEVKNDELKLVLKAVSSLPAPGSIGDIVRALPNLSRRTIQRRLTSLIKSRQLTRQRVGRATRYSLPEAQTSQVELSLSSAGETVRRRVRQPLAERRPVGYNRQFLDDYVPNRDFYLPPPLRGHLREIGSASSPELPAGTYARNILDRLLIDLSWNSSRLEGNTYSLLDTERLIRVGQIAEGKEAKETQMILNHKRAIELLVNNADEIGFNRYTIQNLHAILSDNLLPNPYAGGRLRSIDVAISGTVFRPLSVPQLIDECFETLLQKAAAIEDPFEQAFFAMVHLPYLQPFEDVNKRVARLAANIPLIKRNLAPLSFVEVPKEYYIDAMLGVYELNRTELLQDVFKWAYERSAAQYAAVHQSLGEPDAFRLRYRQVLYETIAQVVKAAMRPKVANEFIESQAERLVGEVDRDHFMALVETELVGLHEGNFARFGIRPSEFASWQNR